MTNLILLTQDLSGFVTILQLWATICVICFYENILKHVTVSECRRAFCDSMSGLRQKFVGMVSTDDERIIQYEIRSFENFNTTVSHIGKFTFCYLLLLLMILAMWDIHKEKGCINTVLASGAVIYVVYAVIAVFRIDGKYFNNSGTFMVSAILILVLYLTEVYLWQWRLEYLENYGSYNFLTLIVVTLIAIPVLYWGKYRFDEWYFKHELENIQRIEKQFNAYAAWVANPMSGDLDELGNIPYEVKKIFNENLKAEQKRKEIDRYYIKKIREILDQHSVKYFTSVIWRKIWKFIRRMFVKITPWLQIALFVILYIVEIAALCHIRYKS